jgi:hypothetical protein
MGRLLRGEMLFYMTSLKIELVYVPQKSLASRTGNIEEVYVTENSIRQ